MPSTPVGCEPFLEVEALCALAHVHSSDTHSKPYILDDRLGTMLPDSWYRAAPALSLENGESLC